MKHFKGKPSRRQDVNNDSQQHPVAINSWTDFSARKKNNRKTFFFLLQNTILSKIKITRPGVTIIMTVESDDC